MKLQSVRGTHDLFGVDAQKYLQVITALEGEAALFGYGPIFTPTFEFFEVFHRTLGESSDVVSKETYTFEDRGGDKITLRPEGTAGVVRSLVENGRLRELPVRHYYHGPMYRYERPQKGRQRQFHQIGFELIGVESHLGDIEVISLAWSLLKKLNLRGSTQLEINTIGDQESRQSYRSELVKYLTGIKDKLSDDSQKRLAVNPLRILDSKDAGDKSLLANAPEFSAHLNSASKDFYSKILDGLNSLGIPFEQNQKLVRGLDYYRHCVFEIKNSELGAQDTILGGGRYDGLVEMMGGPATPAVGWAAGIERLCLLLPDPAKPASLVFVVATEASCDNAALKLANELREQMIGVEVPYSGNMSKKMKKADKAQAPFAIIIGPDELAKNAVVIKDLRKNTQQQHPIDQVATHLSRLLSTKV